MLLTQFLRCISFRDWFRRDISHHNFLVVTDIEMYFCNNNKCLGLSKFNHGSLFKSLMAMHERITKLRQHFFTFGS